MTNEFILKQPTNKIKGITTQVDYKLETILDNHSVCDDEHDIIVRIIGSQISKGRIVFELFYRIQFK